MLRIVADANVLVSAALARSPQAPSVLALDAALDGRIELVTSPLLLREIAMVLARPRLQKYLSAEEAARFLADLAAQTILLADPKDPPAVCRDSRDDYLLALATASDAEAIVTGDLDLLEIDPTQLSVEVLCRQPSVFDHDGLGAGGDHSASPSANETTRTRPLVAPLQETGLDGALDQIRDHPACRSARHPHLG
jgi:putative PIN family toxin of toxin-antitoxin system